MDHKTTTKSKHLHWCQLLGIAPSTWHLVTQWFYRMTLWRMILLSSPYRWAKWGPASPNKKPTVPQAVSGTTAHTKQPGFAASALEHHTFLLHLSPREISWQSPVNISLHWLLIDRLGLAWLQAVGWVQNCSLCLLIMGPATTWVIFFSRQMA